MKDKKVWETPTLTVLGKVEDLTQSGGGFFTDVPQETPINGHINLLAIPRRLGLQQGEAVGERCGPRLLCCQGSGI
jgi:hypothetical protein